MEFERTLTATTDASDELPAGDGGAEMGRRGTVGRFVLLDTLGAGAMGVVYAAYDPELDRKVALKLLLPRAGGTSDDGARTRLVREAQALAKLSHPNVVAVHAVGTHGDTVWIAMEFVAGQTLAVWAASGRRGWSEVLPVLADVARGVAAAHKAGLVHRDLKPDNVMLGRDGRVRVMDFGLAHGRSAAAGDDPAAARGDDPQTDAVPRAQPGLEPMRATGAGLDSTLAGAAELASTLAAGLARASIPAGGRGSAPISAALASPLTAMGTLQGTPAYMAPEQWQGREAQPSTDQFGWSVMAWELLYGESPFAGDSMATRSEAVLAGRRRPPPRGSRVPGWLRRALERGLATEPSRRWPTMSALLATLERGQQRARIRGAMVILAAAVLLGLGAEGYRRWGIARRVAACEVAGAEIDDVWHADARQRLRGAFTATGIAGAATTAEKVMPWLDGQAGVWKQARTEVCLNIDVRALWDADMVDRALWCLADRRREMASLITEFAAANASTVHKAVFVASAMKAVDPCLNEDMLRRLPTPPTQSREVIHEVHAKLARADALANASEFKEALAVATQAREQAEAALAWPPLQAAALAHEGLLLERAGDFEAAEAVSTRAYFAAARSGAWDVAADSAIDLIHIVGHRKALHKDGLRWGEHAEVALVHAGDPLELAEAQRLNSLGNVYTMMGELAAAQTLLERALAIAERALGPVHPNVARTLGNLSIVHMHLGEHAKARPLLERTLAIHEQTLGPDHPQISLTLNNLAILSQLAGDYATARAMYERALASTERVLGPEHPEVAGYLNNLGNLLESTGAHAEARAMHERSLAITQKTLGPEHPDAAQSLFNIATVHVATGAYADAWTLLERALAIQEKALGPESLPVAATLDGLGQVRLAEERPQEALALLRRAVAIFDARDGGQEGEEMVHFHLARALVATDGDRASALAMATKARDGLREYGPDQARALAEVELWLAEQARRP